MSLSIFVCSVGEPVTLETVARLKKFSPSEATITVWYDTRCQHLAL